MEPVAPPSPSGPASTAADRSLRRRGIARAIFLVLTLITLYVLWPSLLKVLSAWPDLLKIEPGWFVVMFGAEIASFASAWALQRLALRTGRWFAIATAQIAGNAFSRIVPGGAAAGAAIQFRLLVLSGLDPTTIGTGLTATTLISSATLFALPVIALPAIAFGAPAPPGLVQSAWLGGALFVLAIVVGTVLLSADGPLVWVGSMIQGIQNRMRGNRPPKTGTPEKLVRERNEIRGTLGSRWWLALITAWSNWLLDYLALLAAVAAVGARPRPALVLLAYVTAAVLGMIPITPGGLGFVEAGLTATLTLAGVSAADAVLATLAYRLVSYWLPLIAGPFAYLAHRRRYAKRVVGVVAHRKPARDG
ncbi:MAG: lysylphosphatidylglycerol synthase transmembrane domain-containing protein [Actinomycetota bacterium]